MKAKPSRGLGRGLGSLLPSDLDTSQLIADTERVQNISLEKIMPNPDQPRTSFNHEDIMQLAESIKQHGVIQPIIINPTEQDRYSIIAGERRWRAAKKAGLKTIPSVVRTHDAQDRLELALIENVQRVDLSPIEQAISIERLRQQFNMTYRSIARKLGKAPPTINNLVRLLQLPQNARIALSKGKISEGHARAILALKDLDAKQQELLDHILTKNWSVRQAEQFAIAGKESRDHKNTLKARMSTNTPATRSLAKKLKTDVSIKRLAKGGFIEIAFGDDDHLSKILELLD